MKRLNSIIIICIFFITNLAIAEGKIKDSEPMWKTRFENFLN